MDGIGEQWLKDTIPWMRAQHGIKVFKLQIGNGKFNSKAYTDLEATSGGILVTNYPYPFTFPMS